MKQRRQPPRASAQQPLRDQHGPPRLADLPDVFGVPEFCAVLGISETTFYRLKRHGSLPVRPLPLRSSAIRFSNEAVRAFLLMGRKAS